MVQTRADTVEKWGHDLYIEAEQVSREQWEKDRVHNGKFIYMYMHVHCKCHTTIIEHNNIMTLYVAFAVVNEYNMCVISHFQDMKYYSELE